jgi:hypothetical protein
MTLFTLCRSHRRVLIVAGALGLAMLAAPQAQAFTIDDQNGANSGNAARLADPAARLSGNGNSDGAPTVIRQGNTTLQFGSQRPSSNDSRYNTERMFNPNGRPD